jgi:nucleoside-diphosphate-sugar epimerase
MKLIVTGGTGFIGSHFLRVALAAGHEVIAIRRPGSVPRVPVEGPLQWVDAELAAVDFKPFGDLSQACLVHLAAYGVSPQLCEWDLAFRYNVSDSVRLMAAAIEAGTTRSVVCGSCVEYGRSGTRFEFIPPTAPLEPIGAYATSKAAQTLALTGMAREAKIGMTVLRPFTVFGEGQHPTNFWPSLRRAALAGADFAMSEGSQIRDFMEVGSVARAFLAAATEATTPPQPLILNVGTGVPKTLRAFAEEQWQSAGASGRLLPGKIPMRTNEVARYVPEIKELQLATA